jgi:hypothetical protein
MGRQSAWSTDHGRRGGSATYSPPRAPGQASSRYTAAIRYLRPPALFENRHSYRLMNVDWSDAAGELTFALATFFDKLDVSEPLSHEAQRQRCPADWTGHMCRSEH